MNRSLLQRIAGFEKAGKTAVRFGIAIIFIWIGSLKFFPHEADGIVPFVSKSPFLSWFYTYPNQYQKHFNPEGALVPENREWHARNNTYGFSYGLGCFLIAAGLLVAL